MVLPSCNIASNFLLAEIFSVRRHFGRNNIRKSDHPEFLVVSYFCVSVLNVLKLGINFGHKCNYISL